MITEAKIDAAAKALRERLQQGKRLIDWSTLPNATKKKWREYATVALTAAEAAN